MRNLKKVLALVLTLAMMLSVMVMNTGAVFTDQKDIEHTDAVDMCVALKIINGYTDGSYRPNGDVTRAEMCKMICVAMNGGKTPVVSASATPVFTDVPSTHWAVGYVESCAAQGIVAGIGGGKFNPDGKVTGTEAAKMLLIALGYDAQQEGFVGSSWDVNTNVKATQKGLYENLEDIDVTAPLTREHAAEMLWNALQADEVEYTYTLVSGPDGSLTSKVTVKDKTGDKAEALSDWYGTKDTDKTGGLLTGIKYNTTKDEWTYTVQELGDNNVLGASQTFTSDEDFTDLFGHVVTFVVKDNKDADVYGAFADDSVVVASGLVGDFDTDDLKWDGSKMSGSFEFDDTDYDVDPLVSAYEFGASNHQVSMATCTKLASIAAFDAEAPYNDFVAIDWDDDDDVDLVLVYAYDFGEVTYVGSDYVRIDGAKYNSDADDNEYVVYDGVAKEDYALIAADTTLVNDGIISQLEKMSGKVASYNKDTAVIDGTGYDYTALPEVSGNLQQTALKNALDKNVDFYVINDYLVDVDAASTVDLNDFVLITGTPIKTGTGYYEVSALFTDGTSDTIVLKSVDGTAKKDAGYANACDKIDEGTLWTYEVSSGKYELSSVVAANTDFDTADGDGKAVVTGAWTESESSADANAKIGGCKIDADAVIFVVDDDDYSVQTGADVSKVTDKSADVTFFGAEDNDNGYSYVTFAVVFTDGVTSSDWEYAFVISDIGNAKDADGTYKTFTAWNGAEVELTTIDTTDLSLTGTLAEQAIIKYKTDAEGAVTDIEVLLDAGATPMAVKACDGETIEFYNNSTSYDLDEDTVYLYIAYDDETGDASGVISTADEVDGTPADPSKCVAVGSDYYYANAFFAADSSDDVEVIVVDVNNDWFALQ